MKNKKLTEQQGTFSPAASRQTLIRRACYDLTGLPPAPAEVAAFLADPAIPLTNASILTRSVSEGGESVFLAYASG